MTYLAIGTVLAIVMAWIINPPPLLDKLIMFAAGWATGMMTVYFMMVYAKRREQRGSKP